jgi:predicted  nucleic acid-binding Zn-ribbon protein
MKTVTADEVFTELTKNCQRVAERKVKEEVTRLKKEKATLQRRVIALEKKLKPAAQAKRDAANKLLAQKRALSQRENDVRKAAQEVIDQYEALLKLKGMTIEKFVAQNKRKRSTWYGPARSNMTALRKLRQAKTKRGKK